jgi:hypothetical protein
MSYKSYIDIQQQAERVYNMSLYSRSYKSIFGKPSKSFVYQMAAHARAQHGISLFCNDKYERKPMRTTISIRRRVEGTSHEDTPQDKPPTKAQSPKVKFSLMSDNERLRYEKLLNDGANHQMKKKVLAWIGADMAIKINGLYKGDPLEIPKWLVSVGNEIISEATTKNTQIL